MVHYYYCELLIIECSVEFGASTCKNVCAKILWPWGTGRTVGYTGNNKWQPLSRARVKR